MVGAATTTKYCFDLQPGDIYWCTADCGWITGARPACLRNSPMASTPPGQGHSSTCLQTRGTPAEALWLPVGCRHGRTDDSDPEQPAAACASCLLPSVA